MNSNQITLAFISSVCVLAGLFFAATLAQADYLLSVVLVVGVCGTIWVVVGSRFWWLPLPFAIVAGGLFQFGFKIYPYELAIAAGMAAILPAVIISFGTYYKGREALPISIILLLGYLFLHWAGSIAYNRYLGMGGIGNVTRSYGAALWVMIFIVLFHWFGSTKQLRIALWLMYGAALLRLATGLAAHFLERSFTVPIVNYTAAGFTSFLEGAGAQDLRHSGLMLCGLSFALLPLSRNLFQKALMTTGILFSLPILLLGGGRAPLIMWFFYPLLYCIIYRKIASLIAFVVTCAIVISFININPESLEVLPKFAQRSASILIIKEGAASAQDLAGQSNLFHKRFTEEAYARWTQNLWTMTFGTGIRPAERGFDITNEYGGGDFGLWLEAMVTTAANTGNYEKGLWTLLAVTGVVGLLLYLNVFRWLSWNVGAQLIKNKINTPGMAFGYLGIVGTLFWMLLSFKSGGYPSYEIFCLYLAYQAKVDNDKAERSLAQDPTNDTNPGAHSTEAPSQTSSPPQKASDDPAEVGLPSPRFPFVKKNISGALTPHRNEQKRD